MIIASDNSEEGTGMDPVSLTEIHYIERLIHTSTLCEEMKTQIERRLANVEFKEEVYEIIDLLRQNQKKNLNEELDDLLRRAI